MRDELSDIMNEISNSYQIKDKECMKLLADILRYTLTIFVHQEVSDFKFLYVIMEVSQNLYYSTNKNRKVYLTSQIYDHGIWQDLANWKECIDYMIRLKIEDANRRRKRKQEMDKLANKGNTSKRNTISNLVGISRGANNQESSMFKKGFKSLKNLMQTKEDKFKEELKQYGNMIFNELSRYVTHFINLNLPYEYAHEILLWCCEEYCMEKT